MEKPSFIGFLLFAIIGLSLKMQSGTAIQCDLGETITTAKVADGDACRKELRTNCGLQGRVVSQLELNAWDPKKTNEKTCEGCCRVQPGPVAPLPAWWGVCAVTDIEKSFNFPNYSGNDCRRCHDGCKPRCDAVGARVGDQICGYFSNGKTNVGLNCICCCRKQVPYPPPPPPSPPPPSPPPPPPSPSPPSPSPPPPSPPPPSPSPPPPSPPPPSPPPPPPSPPPPSPPPPPRNMCYAGDKYSQITYYSTKDCSLCQNDCQTQCSATSMTKQMCTVKLTSVSCQCCCKSSPGATISFLSLATA
ncbi:hypothetical protein MKX03_016426 [Papaver bracteatum]|nr:hypothetical protein MKX03_016426 [Papaver bracteatum]